MRSRLLPCLLAVLLGGCLTVSPSVVSSSAVAPLSQSINASQGTRFSEGLLLVGYGLGGELPGGMFGLHAVQMGARMRSTDQTGAPQTLTANVNDVTLVLGYPVVMRGGLLLFAGGEWTLRRTSLGVTGRAPLASEGTAFVLRPRLASIVSLGKHLSLSPSVSYDVPVISNDALYRNDGQTVRAALSGVNARLSITFMLYPFW